MANPKTGTHSPEKNAKSGNMNKGKHPIATNMEDAASAGPDLQNFAENLTQINHFYQQLMHHCMVNCGEADPSEHLADQMHIGEAFATFYQRMMEDPASIIRMQYEWWDDYLQLLQHMTARWMGQESTPPVPYDPKDRRFKDEAWQEHPGFDFIKQFYLMTAKRIETATQEVEGLDPHTKHKVAFYTRQFLDALSPSNYPFMNPEVLRTTLESDGENLVRGMENLLRDIKTGRISMTDVKQFEVGKNIACTPGDVVFQNELIQLIQYKPTTEKVHETPVLMIPAWINKYYIFDLQAKNSMVKWLVDQGHTVFVISWVNPTEKHREFGFEDYMKLGPVAAVDAIEKQLGIKKVSAIGYCLGGTLLSITLAWMKAKGDTRITNATYLTTLTDFSNPGDLGVFVDDSQLEILEKRMSEKGYLDGTAMAHTFNMLRANDLIWHFVINNYLLGKDPFPFDLLYWNSDVTRMPAKMHSYYLRNMYQKNLLAKPGGITLDGVKIDLGTIETPSYMLSTREDHIAPWESTYKATQFFKGPVRFVLAASGHVAGVINPPAKKKYNFWSAKQNPKSPREWLRSASATDGSWWPDWVEWNKSFAGKMVPARDTAKGTLKPIEPAPGSYVKARV